MCFGGAAPKPNKEAMLYEQAAANMRRNNEIVVQRQQEELTSPEWIVPPWVEI